MNDRQRGAPDLVALYVPGNRPTLFEKALVGPDVVILDLEDAVPLAGKDDARRDVRSWVDGLDQAVRARISVRVNAVGTHQHVQDISAVAELRGLHSVRVPKVESSEDIAAVSAVVGDIPVHALLETARGIEAAATVAASPGVGALAIGEADLRSDLGVTADDGLAWARSRVVVAARAAGLPSPMMSAWTDLEDDEGLLASCRAGRGMGFLGRTAVHPRQVPTIRAGFAPGEEEVAHAKALLRHLGDDHDERGIAVTESGHMVDRAMVRNAEQVLALHDASR